MEVGRGQGGFLNEFLSRFAAACRCGRPDDGNAAAALAAAAGPADAPETRIILVRITGEVLLHSSAQLAQVRVWGSTDTYLLLLIQ